MSVSATAAQERGMVREHGFHPLPVRRVVHETADARSFVLDVPAELRDDFAYDAGQFCNVRVWIDGRPHVRCYSMSSAPAIDAELQITVKRVPGGLVSNWMNDQLAPGDVVETSFPAGFFRLPPGDRDVVACSAGSGITPVFSLVKAALATTSRRVHLLYANRDRDAVIFAEALDALVGRHPGRLDVVHHLDVEHGFVEDATIRPFVDVAADPEFYVCGPGPFMEIVERTLLEHAVDPGRIHIERFAVADLVEAPEPVAEPAVATVTIELEGRTATADHRPGTTVLQAARQIGMAPPYSCELGSCATCMAKVVDGAVTMRTNNVLTDDEVADGWVLTCQAVPSTPSVHVVYQDG
jgi:3-ketosteroid 9alpha-monooxygenase subunit B